MDVDNGSSEHVTSKYESSEEEKKGIEERIKENEDVESYFKKESSLSEISVRDSSECEEDSSAQENPFEDLSKVDLSGSRGDSGYYGYYTDHDPSQIVKLDKQDITNSSEQQLKPENLCSIDISKANTLGNSIFTYEYKSKNSEFVVFIDRRHLTIYYIATRDLDPIQLYTQLTKKTGGWGKDGKEYKLKKFQFRLHLDDKQHREVIWNSRRLKRLPNIKLLWIYYIKEEGDRNVQDFLLNVAPLTLEQFVFWGDRKNRLNVSFYLEGMHAVLKSTTRLVSFSCCMFSSSELQSIFIAAKHIEELQFNGCKLDVTDEFDVSQQTFNIKKLELMHCGYVSGWNNNDELEILIKAVANSPLKHSLKQIKIGELRNIEYEDKVIKIFERHQLKDVLKL